MVRIVLGSRARRLGLALIVLAQLLPLALARPAALAQSTAAQLETVPDRYIVMLRGTSVQSTASVAATVNKRRGAKVDQVYQTVFQGFAGSFTSDAVRDLMRDPAVAAV
jgi:hypothetical protein